MLKQRVITGVILGLAVLLIIFLASAQWVAWITAAFVLLAAWEWTTLSGVQSLYHRIGYLFILAVLMWFIGYLPLMLVMLVASVWWVLALYFVVIYPKHQDLWISPLRRLLIGGLVLLPFWLAMNALRSHPHGDWILLFCFVLVWAADIGAYFAGRRFGKTKLMPRVSPGKTWEGFLGGLLASMLVASVVSAVIELGFHGWFSLLLFVVLLNIYAVVGDLLESMLKRYCQVKDSGNILPGHGGILDRIDSLTAATPLFLLGLLGYLYY